MPTGNIADPLSLNYYTYSANNPIYYCDPSGNAWETVFDVASLIESTASLLSDPSIQNAVFFTWDAASAVLPFIPGSYIAKGVKWFGKTNDAFDAVKAIDNTVDFADDIHDVRNTVETVSDVAGKGWKIGDNISFSPRNLQHEFANHSEVFNIKGNWNNQNKMLFENAIIEHVNSVDNPILGTYRNKIDVYHFYDTKTNINVMIDKEGNLVGVWELSSSQVEYLFKSGNIQ